MFCECPLHKYAGACFTVYRKSNQKIKSDESGRTKKMMTGYPCALSISAQHPAHVVVALLGVAINRYDLKIEEMLLIIR